MDWGFIFERTMSASIGPEAMVFALADGQLQPKANSMPSAEKFARAGYDVAALLEPR